MRLEIDHNNSIKSEKYYCYDYGIIIILDSSIDVNVYITNLYVIHIHIHIHRIYKYVIYKSINFNVKIPDLFLNYNYYSSLELSTGILGLAMET